MELWIRSTAKTNLLQARFLTIMEGKTFYKKMNGNMKDIQFAMLHLMEIMNC